MQKLLEINNLTQIYNKSEFTEIKALDDVSFRLYKGEILGIVGESGSGKSTIARAVMRLIKVKSGSIILDEKDITTLKGSALRNLYKDIQMVFQSPIASFNPRYTLGNSIGESLKNFGVPQKEIREKTIFLLGQCGLSSNIADCFPYEVSGGQCQRAAIARALASQPKILICDEATSALDVTVQEQIMELLKKLQQENNLSLIFISHDIALVQIFCNRVIVMKDGKIIETGGVESVITRPQNDYTIKLIESMI